MRPGSLTLPGPIHLVVGDRFLDDLSQARRVQPYLPADLGAVLHELRQRPEGVAVLLDRSRGRSANRPVVRVHTRHTVLRLTRTDRATAYFLSGVDALGMRDHHQLAQGCLLVRPASWLAVRSLREVPFGASAYWEELTLAWRRSVEGRSEGRSPRPSYVTYLDRLDRMIEATRTLTADTPATYAYRAKSPTGERREGAHSVYVFDLVSATAPEEGAYVRLRVRSGQRGQVTQVDGRAVTVRFDDPVDWSQLADQGELEETPGTIVFDTQHRAVDDMRTGRATGARLLPALVDHVVGRSVPRPGEPTVPLNPRQEKAFRVAMSTDDLALILGPPGTGKTRTISQIAAATAGGGSRVLVTSRNNRAVDNVLPALPRELVVVRVGNVGSVTADGRPYLLDVQASELCRTVRDSTSRALEAYADIEAAHQWAEETARRSGELRAATAARAAAEQDLWDVRRMVGGSWAGRLDAAVADLRSQEAQQARNRAAIDDLSATAARLAGRRGPVVRTRSWIVTRRLSRSVSDRDSWTAAVSAARATLAAAEQGLDAATCGHPEVVGRQGALLELIARERAALVAALDAAGTVAALLSPVERVDPPTADLGEQGLAGFLQYLAVRLPVFAARARILADWRSEVSGPTAQLHPELIRYADVVAATCIGSASRPELSALEFDLAIVDEAGQICATDLVVPLARSSRAVIVGDPQQLPPYLDAEVEQWGAGIEDGEVTRMLSRSALELMVGAGWPSSHVVQLVEQRRMPEVVAEFASRQFYGGLLYTGVRREHGDDVFAAPMVFVDTAGLEPSVRGERPGRLRDRWGVAGYDNPTEARLLAALAVRYHRAGAEWAVIVPYKAQVALVRKLVARQVGHEAVEANIGSVDSFQGGERDVVLFGYTRSNPEGRVGFLSELRRTNVAFTRTRSLLVVVGDSTTLTHARDDGFRALAVALLTHVAREGEVRNYAEVLRRVQELEGGGRV